MEIGQILKNFVKECSEKLNLISIVQFGSSTYLANPNDVDLVFFSKDLVFESKDYDKLFIIIRKFEKKHAEVVFDIAGGKRNKKAKFEISIIPLSQVYNKYILDKIFLKMLYSDKNKKILFGKDIFSKNVLIPKEQLIQTLIFEINHSLRGCLEKETRNDFVYHLFKSTLKLMFINESESPKKMELLSFFNKKYSEIKLPNNADKIIKNKILEKDLWDVVKFTNDCIKYLNKNE